MKEIKDHYFFKAKKEGYPARSVYKLIEAQKRFRFIKAGDRILDLGASPGSWSKYAAKSVGKRGLVVAVDLHGLKVSADNIFFFKKSIFDEDIEDILARYTPFDVVLSDMAPKTSGRRDIDHYRSIELATSALEIASRFLKKGGSLYCKFFDGEDFVELRKKAQEVFGSVKVFKPKSSRSESVEKFLFCTKKKQ